MPWLMQMAGCAVMIVGVALAVWIGFWLLLVLAVLSLFVAGWRYLVRKGIINATPGVPPGGSFEETTEVTIIEGDFTHAEDESKRIE